MLKFCWSGISYGFVACSVQKIRAENRDRPDGTNQFLLNSVLTGRDVSVPRKVLLNPVFAGVPEIHFSTHVCTPILFLCVLNARPS